MLKKIAVCVTALAALSGVVPPPALAAHEVVRDGNDTRGVLDVRRVDVWGLERPRWKIGTWGSWTARKIWDKGFLVVHLDSFGDGRFDYYALIRSNRTGMQGLFYRDYTEQPDDLRGTLPVWRKSRRNVSVRVPLSLLWFPGERRKWTWKVETLVTNDACRNVCFDWAPNDRRVREPQPGQGR